MTKKRRKSKKAARNPLGYGVIVGQKARQRLLPKFYVTFEAAGKEADLWSDAKVIPLTGQEYNTKGELWEAHRRELEKEKD